MFYSYIYHECLNTSCTEISSTYYKIMELKEKSLYSENYLTNRTQKVFIECHSSWIGSTHVGVPQGSLLGPFLFHIFNNDISDINLKSNQIRLFADHIYVLVVVVDNTRNAAKSLTADPEIVKNVLE